MTDGNIGNGVAGGPVRHIPVMLNEVLECLRPSSGSIVIDGTFGAGGYTLALLEAGARVLAVDRDPDAIRDGAGMVSQYRGRLELVSGEFADLDEIARDKGHETVDGVVLDIGVSSMQLDQPGRGFSFREDGPLDMRMSQDGLSAADVVNQARLKDLIRIIGILGEERKAALISREIVKTREIEPIRSTRQLAGLIEKIIHRKPQDKIHPATRTFQALRIFVNRELEQLCRALFAAERILAAGGRLVVVTFHSLEDRIVKQFFRDRSGGVRVSRHLPAVNAADATFQLKGSGLLKASKGEAETNPRARSAKLRFGVRTPAKARAADLAIFGLPDLAGFDRFSPGEAG